MKLLSLLSTLFVISVVTNSYAQMTNLGSFGSEKSNGTNISGDGSVIGVNRYSGVSTYTTAILYNNGSTIEIPTLGGAHSLVYGLSKDGSVVVGYAQNGSGNNIAIKYSSASGTQSLGTLTGGSYSVALGVSNDGSVIVGNSSDANSSSRAFKYSSAGGMVDIGSLDGNATDVSSAIDISGDGSIIVGDSGTTYSTQHAFKYTDLGGMVDLGTLGGTTSNARGISNDGSVIVGYSDLTGNTATHAFKYTDLGGMVDIGTLGGTKSFAYDVSGDGSITVGYSTDNSGNNRAFKHDDTEGMVSLGTLGGDNSYAYAISDDGSIIIGSSETASGGVDTFIYKNSIVSLDQTVETLYDNNVQLNSIFNIKNSLIKSTLKRECSVFGSKNICMGLGLRYSGVDNHNAQEQAANVIMAYKINDNVRVGGVIDQTVTNSMPGDFKTTNFMPTVGIYGNYNSKKDQSGINVRLAATFDDTKTTISRKKHQYSEAGSGSSNISSYGLLAELSYQMNVSTNLSLKPSLGMRKTNISREGYKEYSHIDFPITYETIKQNVTSGVLGLKVNYKLNQKTSFSLGAEFEDNFERRMDGYVGNMAGVGSFNMNPYNLRKNTLSVDVGSVYNIDLNQRVESFIGYGQQAFNDANNTTIYFSYVKGF